MPGLSGMVLQMLFGYLGTPFRCLSEQQAVNVSENLDPSEYRVNSS